MNPRWTSLQSYPCTIICSDPSLNLPIYIRLFSPFHFSFLLILCCLFKNSFERKSSPTYPRYVNTHTHARTRTCFRWFSPTNQIAPLRQSNEHLDVNIPASTCVCVCACECLILELLSSRVVFLATSLSRISPCVRCSKQNLDLKIKLQYTNVSQVSLFFFSSELSINHDDEHSFFRDC